MSAGIDARVDATKMIGVSLRLSVYTSKVEQGDLDQAQASEAKGS